MVDQSYDIGFSFIETPVREKKTSGSERKNKFAGDMNGVLEVSQDVTEIRNLKGEKRLLDWE